MRNLLMRGESFFVWAMFFATAVYGHVAMKLATGNSAQFEYGKAVRCLVSFWGWSAMLAWAVSGVLWAVVLTKESLVGANSISAARYVLICLAAWIFLREGIRFHHAVGILLVTVGIWLCTR
jgi:uncharacterized membrane protein